MPRIRNTDFETVHHLTSRIAHRAFFLKSSERNDFLNIVKRVSAFSGVELIGWCIMNNHFHLFVYLPTPRDLSDQEVMERFRRLKGNANRILLDETGKTDQIPFARNDVGDAEARASFLNSLRRRMYSIAEYMRIIKKWFTEDYNDRNGHKGTMWESVYNDHPMYLPEDLEDYTDLRDILAYIHLNPIRAAMTDRFDGYEWSSYTAYRRGDPDAVKAMHFAYRGYDNDAEIIETHEARMNGLLEDWKRRKAEEIARKRAEGYELPKDALTDECLIAQAAAHAAEVQKELESLHAERELVKGAKARRELIIKQIRHVAALHPDLNAGQIASVIHVPVRTVYRYMKAIKTGKRDQIRFANFEAGDRVGISGVGGGW